MTRFLAIFFFLPFLACAQLQPPTDAARIKLKLRKLNFLGSVLYVAAHPDDENTRIITALANGRLAASAYLSMTRGDGGQNLIGPEIRDVLGLIRTQELLTARTIDGGDQFFTRANDFGYSKSAEETFSMWGKQDVLHDVVAVYRQFKPDVIITRFPPDERAGHGHHTASAILAQEAFDVAADKDVFPELAKAYGTWQARRLYTNTGRWWNTTIDENTPGIITLDVGGYSPLLGESYSEIAARSRSQHKSQGFGSRGTRGYQPEFLEYIKGEKATRNIFEGVDTTWNRVKGASKVAALVLKVNREFNEEQPEGIVPTLIALRKEMQTLPSSVWKTRKLEEVGEIIQDCLGLFVGVAANTYWSAPGQTVTVNVEVVNRSSVAISLVGITAPALQYDSACQHPLKNNIPLVLRTERRIGATQSYSDPYWLREPHSEGLFTVRDKKLIGTAANAPAIVFEFTLKIAGELFTVTRPLIYRWTDPVKGELTRPFEIVPPVFVNIPENVMLFTDNTPRDVQVLLKSAIENVKGNLQLQLPSGWRSEPAQLSFELGRAGDEAVKNFMIYPASAENISNLKAVATIDGRSFDLGIQTVAYDHLPTQTLLPKASAKLVRVDLKKSGNRIGYIKGAGDDVPSALRHMGYDVWEMKDAEITLANLKRLDAVVLGIRALNTHTRLPFVMPELLTYVKDGGTLVVQYNTNGGLKTEKFAPVPIRLSRNRVTEENADVRILKPDHPVMNVPNKITPKDFEGWVQERGLYFPDQWDPSVEAILSMNDRGENPMDGSLLVTQYGKGYYIYTGLSFFRELPEGVPGAYKLFANIVSLGEK